MTTDKPDQTNESDGASARSNAWPKAWFDCFGRLAAAGFSFPPESNPPAAIREMRDAFLGAMAASCEEYMRSPEFLEMMKTSMDRAIAFRTQMNEWLRRAYSEAQLPAREDIEVLAGRMQSIERELLSRVESIERKLTTILERLPAPGPLKSSAPHADRPATSDRAAQPRTVRRKSRKR